MDGGISAFLKGGLLLLVRQMFRRVPQRPRATSYPLPSIYGTNTSPSKNEREAKLATLQKRRQDNRSLVSQSWFG